MPDRRRVVGGALQALQEIDLQRVLLGHAAHLREQPLHLGAVAEIAGPEAVAQRQLAEFRQPLRLGILVDAVDGNERRFLISRATASFAASMNSSTSWWEMSFSIFSSAGRPALVIEPDLHLREIEVERALAEAVFAQERSQHPRRAHRLRHLRKHGVAFVRHARRGGGHGLPAGHRESLLVTQPRRAADDRARESAPPIFPSAVKSSQAEKVSRSTPGFRVHTPLVRRSGSIGITRRRGSAVPALERLAVQLGAGANVVRDIGDVHAQPPALMGFAHVDGVVEIAGVVRVDRKNQLAAQILPARGSLRSPSPGCPPPRA